MQFRGGRNRKCVTRTYDAIILLVARLRLISDTLREFHERRNIRIRVADHFGPISVFILVDSIVRSILSSWVADPSGRPPPRDVPLRERFDLLSRHTQLRLRKALTALKNWRVPPAYRTRVIAACFLVVAAIISRIVFRGRPPLLWLFTGTVYNRTFENGATLVIGPGIGWVAVSILMRFMLHRPERAPAELRPHVD